jgi:conflict system STAND superfamily ATPase
MAIGAYRLDELGWLQFERLCELVLGHEAGLEEVTWLGRADRGRVALLDDAVALRRPRLRLPGPMAVAVVWVRPSPSQLQRRADLVTGASAVPSELGFWFDRVLLLTNLHAGEAREWLGRRLESQTEFVVLGADELGDSLDHLPAVRAAMPSVLGLRDLEALIAPEVRERSTLDVASAQALARVFWPTRAYERARAVLTRHRFVVLTGPPEMGKTAIAKMLALAGLTDGWEAHECTRPDQVWRAFDRERRQLFVADDAFGSTEYRADAAELWARELGRMLGVLDDRHWLIWTSRPAPLKAGLRRVQRERGSEHFPAPGEVLVDAGEFDLAEKTLILFRHAKAHDPDETARNVVRSAGVSIVEHSHFTPERIRRLVAERLDELVVVGEQYAFAIVEDELARPTDAMRNSFRALEDEHRELLIALLDAPAGLIDERELAATVRRHHTGGLRRPPGELIDRLTDHFLRITPLGIGWVHPSWRDLVIDELAEDGGARGRFLSACGIYGVLLALSGKGGASGERALPLLICDTDWDTLGDRIGALLAELEDQDLARLLFALADALGDCLEPGQRSEIESLTGYVLGASSRSWHKHVQAVPVFLLEAWYAANAMVAESPSPEPPPIRGTWNGLAPSRALLVGGLTARDLQELDDWLTLAQILVAHDPDALRRLGFYESAQQVLLAHLAIELGEVADPDLAGLAENLLRRIRELSPRHHGLARTTLIKLQSRPPDQRWWVPQDIDAPPSTEPVSHDRIGFTREDVGRVLADL